ncbi:MAG: polyprenyl synthetase family protein [Marinifilaceae bacterium]|nr:polyprenyl synthetase family protein [Marinifilaceae bacterium]
MYTFKELRDIIQRELDRADYVEYPEQLFEPVRYLIADSGKRLRPVIALMSYNLFHEDITPALKSAIGIEIFHNYTLLHDDVMDDAPIRRGLPTVHQKWNKNVAILSGDAAAIVAYQHIEHCEDKYLRKVITFFNQMAMDICKGQQLDMEFETRNDVTVDEYIRMIYWKTSVLLAGSMRHGALIAGASEEIYNALYDLGGSLGLAFQLQDDYLDVYGDEATFGKQIGGDITINKKTFMLIKALELADDEQRAELQYWISLKEFDKAEKIQAVTALYNAIGIKEIALTEIANYLVQCKEILRNIPIEEERKSGFYEMISLLEGRNT